MIHLMQAYFSRAGIYLATKPIKEPRKHEIAVESDGRWNLSLMWLISLQLQFLDCVTTHYSSNLDNALKKFFLACKIISVKSNPALN